MFYVYAISSQIKKYIYVGLTNNLKRKISQHQTGKEATTAPYCPYILIHKEIYSARKEARQREKYLKSGIGKEFLKSLKY